jgi:hypothetical protein
MQNMMWGVEMTVPSMAIKVDPADRRRLDVVVAVTCTVYNFEHVPIQRWRFMTLQPMATPAVRPEPRDRDPHELA